MNPQHPLLEAFSTLLKTETNRTLDDIEFRFLSGFFLDISYNEVKESNMER